MNGAEVLVARLAELLGPQAAQSAVNTFCKRTVGVAPENLTRGQLKLVLPSLKPLLGLLLGTTRATSLLADLDKELSTP